LKEEGIQLPELPEPDDLSPNGYAAAVARAVEGMPRWRVQTDRMVLGFFSFAKLMMYRDLEPDRWPLKDGLRDHPIINGLLGDGFRDRGESPLPDDCRVDPLVDIASAGHVVDADSSQMLAIEEVQRGRNLVIQGPPGTGKSQTITNLIASAVRQGKRVLFVAEKMAALKVVRANLERSGLGQLCLELHSHKAKKKAVLEDLEETYQLSQAQMPSAGNLADRLRAARDALNDHVRRIHTPLEPSQITPFQVFGKLARLAGKGLQSPEFQVAKAGAWAPLDIEERRRRVKRLAAHVQSMGIPIAHPWRGTGLDVVLPQDAERLATRAKLVARGLEEIATRGQELANRVGSPCSTLQDAERLSNLGPVLRQAPALDAASIANDAWSSRRSDIQALAEHGEVYSTARRRLEGILLPEAWNRDLSTIRREVIEHGRSWLRWLRAEYRASVAGLRTVHIGPLPKSPAKRAEILHILASGQRARQHVRSNDSLGASAFGTMWAGDNSDWDALRAIDSWERSVHDRELPIGWRPSLSGVSDREHFSTELGEFVKAVETATSEVRALVKDLALDWERAFGTSGANAHPIGDVAQHFTVLAAEPERLQQWCIWRTWGQELMGLGLDALVDRIADGRLAADAAPDVFEYVCHEALARQVFAEHPELARFDGRSHEQTLAEFKKLDRDRMASTRLEVQASHLSMMPKGGREVGEVGILAREWRKQRRHLPLRQLVKAAGRAMQLIKPVWMMSPMSLAQFVEPGALQFDLAVMDEASQVRPVEALGAIARATQLVVVGDDKQLPPTSFFERVVADESDVQDPDDFQVADVESVLGLCSSQGINDRMLRWHYRSQHESLIAVSNLEFYRKLYIVPSAETEDLGLRFRKVNGVYDRGRTAMNRLEAREVAAAVLEHARRYGRAAKFPEGMSLAVGTFSVQQRDAILDELELMWRRSPDVADFFDPNAPEPFFVKNLEAIQGDERDVVFISVGYGPDADGYTTMFFGPLSHQGGERRLNVLISRARRRCEVFASITGADIDLSRTQSAGVRILKTFLQYAETGHLDRSQVGKREVDSDFEEDVGNALASLGYQVEHQVGVAGFFVDLAIRDTDRPGRYLLGIECDGATYHASRSARDRDRLREQVLRDRGWNIHRIWSTDWFSRRQEELQRAVAAINLARATSPLPAAKGHAVQERSQPGTGSSAVNSLGLSPLTESSGPNNPQAQLPLAPRSAGSPDYVEAAFNETIPAEAHELNLRRRMDILVRIVAIEGPVHEEEIGRRYAMVCGKERTGARIMDAVREGLAQAVKEHKLHATGPFYTASPLTECTPRDRSKTRSLTLRKPEMLPPIEIQTGLRTVVKEHVGVEPREAIVEVSRMLGFHRTGSELKQTIEGQLRFLLGERVLVLKNGNRLYST
jgi:very-short-patch-repair endonuclease